MPILPSFNHDGGSGIRDGIFLKVVNVLCYILFLGLNIGTLNGPHWGYHQYAKDTYISAAWWAWYIWSAIHLLLLGFVIYQFTPAGKRTIIDGVGWRFPLVAVLNATYVSLWNRGYTIASFVLVLFVSASVSHMYYSVKRHHAAENLNDELWVHVPVGLWQGWSTYLVFLTAFEAFGASTTHHAGVVTKILVFLSLLFLESTSAGYALGNAEGDLAGSAAITWVLWAIFDHQRNSAFIHWSAFAFALLSLFWIVRAALAISNRGHRGILDTERAPLIGGGH